jgi:hypothetical protein
MSSDPTASGPGGEQQITPEQQEMLRQMEEEMRKVRVQDLLTQSVVSILNLAARRIAKDDERDLEQGKLGIDAVRALIDLLEPEAEREVRNALSQIQVLYAQHAGGDEGGEEGSGPASGGPGGGPEGGSGGEGPGEAPGGSRKPPPGLWVPGT